MIDIRDLHRRFGDRTALAGLTLHVAEGAFIGVIGPDGAGKTTMIRTLCGLVRPDEGSVMIAGHDATREAPRVRRLLGYMPQRFSLYPDLSVDENLRFAADVFDVAPAERERRTARLLAASGLGPFGARRARNLSGGMKQKLALACTLIHTPRLLLLDEPTTGVDALSRRDFWTLLRDVHAEGVTVMVATPSMDEARLCDAIALLDRGRLLATGSPAAIAARVPHALLAVECERPSAVADLLETMPEVLHAHPVGHAVHVGVRDAARDGETLRAALAARGIRDTTVHAIAPTLEDAFVALVRAEAEHAPAG